MKTIRIVIIDDHHLVRAGILSLLSDHEDIEVVGDTGISDEAARLVSDTQPDVVLLDIAMPGPSGIDVARTIRRADPDTRILVLSSIDRPDIIEQALDAGVNGYLLKDFVLGELQQALEMVLSGQSYLSPKIQGMSLRPGIGGNGNGTLLTPRQTEILRLVASGRTTKEIARDLGISPKTVEFHRGRLMERIGVRDVTGLTRFALQTGVVC